MIALREAECCALAGTDCRPTALRRRAGRPQLKRDPLGGAPPPHKHPFVNSFGTVSMRGAEGRCSGGRLCSPRPTPHGRAYEGAAPRTSFRPVAAHRLVLNPRRRGRPAARVAFEHRYKARRLTCAWSWRRPVVEVEFHL